VQRYNIFAKNDVFAGAFFISPQIHPRRRREAGAEGEAMNDLAMPKKNTRQLGIQRLPGMNAVKLSI
jgi:hypothetical protein